jgi:hypothetical protein
MTCSDEKWTNHRPVDRNRTNNMLLIKRLRAAYVFSANLYNRTFYTRPFNLQYNHVEEKVKEIETKSSINMKTEINLRMEGRCTSHHHSVYSWVQVRCFPTTYTCSQLFHNRSVLPKFTILPNLSARHI